jgi:protein SCO1/2
MTPTFTRRRILVAASLALALGACGKSQSWELDNVSSVLPDLKFDLVTAAGKKVSAADYAGKVVILYFGYTHCPDVCPLTMSNLASAVQQLGPQAGDAAILFVSLDPARDTPAVLGAYTRAFSAQAVGLTGSMEQIQDVAKRFHVAFNYGAKDAYGNYAVNHSAAIYIFGKDGRGMLIGSDQSTPAAVAHDLRQLVQD